MTYQEITQDLFKVPDHYHLAHCISADFALGKGIAVLFNQHFNMCSILKNKYPHFLEEWDDNPVKGTCIQENKVFNLITKRNYWDKPTYKSITNALISMKALAITKHIHHIAMPLIGCGLDRLQWDKVSQIIKDTFAETDIDILICKQ